jgi:hypothetical protein
VIARVLQAKFRASGIWQFRILKQEPPAGEKRMARPRGVNGATEAGGPRDSA